MDAVKVWEESIVIPTYPVGKKEKNPLFLEKRVYQGSSGAVYPYPVIESVGTEKEEKRWKALFLENAYLKIMILPEIGGRVQMALDKTNGHHFVYYNQVIKPALVGLTGPWISGGIEFNWPQHHRPGTYEPTDYAIRENDDGSASVVIGELEQMSRTRSTVFFTLEPGKAVLDIEVRLFNGSRTPRTFLWWANPAVSVGDHYQSIFPPDVKAVMDHGKRDVSTFPISTGTYYKMDYSAGVDISRYANIPVPTSYMAHHSDYDFIGCYDHKKKAGMLHVANHHLVPGKKQWTWGNGDFGQAWDRILTDEDGPYIELMTGAFTDNQPDFSWLQPNEEKVFVQHFMPYKDLGVVTNASTRAALSLDFSDDSVIVGAYATGEEDSLRIALSCGGRILFEETLQISPAETFRKEIDKPAGALDEDFRLSLFDGDDEILSSAKEPDEISPMPSPARAAQPPGKIRSVEELYLTGLHLEQYRHATRNPEDYYLEALERDPGESRCLTAMGRRDLERADFEAAAEKLERAVERLTFRNPNPYDGEAFFHLGRCRRFLGEDEAAYARFYKAAWNGAWQGAAYAELARISCGRREYRQALVEADRSLAAGAHNRTALMVKAVALRLSGESGASERVLEELKEVDPLFHGAWAESWFLSGKSAGALEELKRVLGENRFSWMELSLEYFWCGRYREAAEILEISGCAVPGRNPLVHYYLGYFYEKAEDGKAAEAEYREAAASEQGLDFVSRVDTAMILRFVVERFPEDFMALYHLGNFLYHNRRYDEAMDAWNRSIEANPRFPTARRNLALGLFNKKGRRDAARLELEKAFSMDEGDARVMFELDQLYKKIGVDPQTRLSFLEAHPESLAGRDDLTLERISLLNRSGRFQDALSELARREFRPWEGGEGRVSAEYVRALVCSGVESLGKGDFAGAAESFEAAYAYPENLGEGKLVTKTDNELDYFAGVALEGLGKTQEARERYRRAAEGDSRPSLAAYYNDQSSEIIFYQGMALRRLGDEAGALGRFQSLRSYGRTHFFDEPVIDYFAVSLPDLLIFEEDLAAKNRANCRYLISLGEYGLGEAENALAGMEELLDEYPYFPGAWFFAQLWKSGGRLFS